MQRFKNILVVVDRKIDCQALTERAVSLARTNQSLLTVITFSEKAPLDMPTSAASKPDDVEESGINIIEEVSPGIPAPITPEPEYDRGLIRDTSGVISREAGIPITWETYMDIQERFKEAENLHLEKIIASIRQAGVQVSGKVLNGTPFLKIIREVLRNGHDLVMIAAEGKGGFRELLFGSTTMHLMRKCPCPVWVFKPDQPVRYTRILAAVDPTPHDEERNALNHKILELATSLARSEHSELSIIYAWTLYGESALRSGRTRLSKEQVDKMVGEIRDTHKRWFITLLREHTLEDLSCRVYLLKGEAGRLIPALAKAREVDLIVMGTVSRTGVAGLLIGNTSEQVLNQVNCSVLTVKPEGFITPVRSDESERRMTQ